MASVYPKGRKLYISWYDPFEGKTKNRSTRLDNTKENRKEADRFAKELQKKIDSEQKRFEEAGIQKASLREAFDHFLKVNNNKAPGTISEYRYFYKFFITSFEPDESCRNITKLRVEDWLIEVKAKYKERNTQYAFAKVLKKFLRFLSEYNYIIEFRINSDVMPKPQVKKIITFSKGDLQKIIAGLENKNDNFATFTMMLIYTGLRPSDIINITKDDIDLETKQMRYYSSKTDEHFYVPLHTKLIPVLESRIEEIKENRIFEYKNNHNAGCAMRRYLKRLGLDKKGYNLRTFRKTFISNAHERGMDLATVSLLVGHRQITTTSKYYHKISGFFGRIRK